MKNKKIAFCGIGACVAIGSLQAAEKQQVESKPNVLFIIMDDMCDWTHYLGGNNQVLTPNLDKLAARAVNFSNAYTAVPLSNPSRTALFTGIQPFVTGVYNNENIIENYPIANNSLFMPQHFRNNGYNTIAAGKIFHTKPSTTVMNNMWDDMANIDGGYGPWIQNQTLPPILQNQWKNFEAWTGPDTDFPDVLNSQKIIDVISQTQDKPFFAAMGFYRPHNPYTAPKRYFDLYNLEDIQRPYIPADDLNDVPEFAINNFVPDRDYTKLLRETGNSYEQMIRAYMACVSFTDDRIGLIMDALDNSTSADNTWIVLIGDNGFHHGEKEHWTKSTLWREANHVPFLIIPPKNNSSIATRNFTTPVSLIDIYPTLIDACGLTPIESQLAGSSLMPILTDANASWDKPSISTFLPGNFVIHSNQWNFISYRNGSQELYDISVDENEITNLADKPEYKHIVDSLATFLPTSWYTGPPEVTVSSISEDFSSSEWDAELLRLNPAYIRPAAGTNFTSINNVDRYFDKYILKGAIVGIIGTPNCVIPEITHGDATSAVAFRLANSGVSSFIELPLMYNAGQISLHVRNGNSTSDTNLTLQKFDAEDWSTIAELPVRGANSFNATSIDEILTYPVNMNEEVKLRVHGGNKFVQIFRVDVTPFGASDLKGYQMDLLKLKGRTLFVSEPTNISLYNIMGVKVFEKKIEREIILPARIGNGIFLVKTNQGTQKIVLNH